MQMRVSYKTRFNILWFILVLFSLVIMFIFLISGQSIKESLKYNTKRTAEFVKDYKKISDFCNSKIEKNSVVIFEPNPYHHECLPGYVKYFVDLGYKVDVLIRSECSDSLNFFEPIDKVRIFTFDNLKDIHHCHKKLSNKFSQYDFFLLQSLDPWKMPLIEELGFLSNPNSLLIAHDTGFAENPKLKDIKSKNRIFGLADYGKLVYLNPNYFGEFNNKGKNSETTFYISSTVDREYYYLLESAKKLKDEGYKFKVKVTGHCDQFNEKNVPDCLKDCFEFYGKVSYEELFSIINGVDFIMLNLCPDRDVDKLFMSKRASGSIQLAYGFSKPLIINSKFSSTYKLSKNNSIFYEDRDLYLAMLRSIEMKQPEYLNMCNNMSLLKDEIYKTSIKNLSEVLDSIRNRTQ